MSRTAALKGEQVKEQQFVDQSGYYYLTLQFGSQAFWRGMKGQDRIERRTTGPDGVDIKVYDHNPKIYERVGPFDGSNVNGLIQNHNDWIKLHRQKGDSSWRGHADRQLLVLGIEPTTDLPDEMKGKTFDMEFVTALLESLVQKQVQSLKNGK